MPMTPLPSPPFHHTSLPPPAEPLRKLHTVRFSTLTPSTSRTSTPLRPPLLGFCAAGDAEQADEPARVPSTTTALRERPRMWMPGVVTITPAPGAPDSW